MLFYEFIHTNSLGCHDLSIIPFSTDSCPKGWISYHDACYQINLARTGLQDANDKCLDQGAGILTLRSTEEETFLRAELEKKQLNNIFYWLGKKKKVIEGFQLPLDHRVIYGNDVSAGFIKYI